MDKQARQDELSKERFRVERLLSEINAHIQNLYIDMRDEGLAEHGLKYLDKLTVIEEFLSLEHIIPYVDRMYYLGQAVAISDVCDDETCYVAEMKIMPDGVERIVGSIGYVPLKVVKSMRQRWLKGQEIDDEQGK